MDAKLEARLNKAAKRFEELYPRPTPRVISTSEWLSGMDDEYIRYIYQQTAWESGNAKTRQACLAEFDKRFGAKNWPSHIERR